MSQHSTGLNTLEIKLKGNKIKKKPPVFYPDFFTGEVENNIHSESSLNKHVYIPNWENKPPDTPAILALNGKSILSNQNTSAIIASPGYGKSSICEAIPSSYLNPNTDCLGLEVNENCKGIIYIDFERTNTDVWNSRFRMCLRAGIKQGEQTPGVIFAGMRSIPRLKERLLEVEQLLAHNPCSLLILDGAGDMVTDTNDLPQAIECRIFLRELTVNYDLSILTTLHPNPNSYKARGHIGSEILREAESVLVVKKADNDCRILTTDFDYGKNRNGSHANSAYKWNDEKKMFLSVDVDDLKNTKQEARDANKMKDSKEMAIRILPPPTSLKHSELISKIMVVCQRSKSTAKRIFDDMIGWNFIKKSEDGFYRLAS